MKRKSIAFVLCMAALFGIACAEHNTETATVEPVATAVTSAPADLLPRGAEPLEGVLTGGQPTEAQLETLAEMGYGIVVNMRGPTEAGSTDPAAVEALGMTYVSIPVTGAADVSEENARRLGEILNQADQPVLLHCASSNRVGALLALEAYYVDGVSPEEALALGKEAGLTRLEPVVKKQLGLE